MLNLLVVVNPAEHPGIKSILDQVQALGTKIRAAGQSK